MIEHEKLTTADYLNAKLPYDKYLFDLSIPWDHIHMCYQCERKFGCNGIVCEYGEEIGWCAECCASQIPKSIGGN